MKKEYEKLIWQIQKDMGKVPLSVAGTRTATIESYISTCRDLEFEHNNVEEFFNYLQQVCFWENRLKKADDYDKEKSIKKKCITTIMSITTG